MSVLAPAGSGLATQFPFFPPPTTQSMSVLPVPFNTAPDASTGRMPTAMDGTVDWNSKLFADMLHGVPMLGNLPGMPQTPQTPPSVTPVPRRLRPAIPESLPPETASEVESDSGDSDYSGSSGGRSERRPVREITHLPCTVWRTLQVRVPKANSKSIGDESAPLTVAAALESGSTLSVRLVGSPSTYDSIFVVAKDIVSKHHTQMHQQGRCAMVDLLTFAFH
jgi:hypothetical protein